MTDQLPSWRDSAARRQIESFVADVTREGGPHYVAPDSRLAVFDNDGTLWSERPAYFQLLFAIDRANALLPDHPEWRDDPQFMALLNGELTAKGDEVKKLLVKIAAVTHANMTTDEFAAAVSEWVETARHPKTGRPYTTMIFQPMLELLDYLRAHDFKTYIVSGGGIEFMRVFAEEVYGIPPQQVIGTSIVTTYEMRAGVPVLVRQPEIDFIDDKEGKPVAINRFIGRRPIMAFGNSDGDHQMLQWTAAGDGLRLMGLVHHTDSEREWAYDKGAVIGGLDAALAEARERDWVVVDMKADWTVIYPPQE